MSAKRTAIDAALTSAGIDITAALAPAELSEAARIVQLGGGLLSKAADSSVVAATCDELVLAPIASQTNTITVRALKPGAGKIASIAIADAGGDTLAVTNVAGAITISLANATDSKNTLTLIKAAIEAANSSTLGADHSVGCFITGTASTQMVHGGTNDVATTAPGGTAAGGLKSSTLGALATTEGLTITPAA